MIIGPTLGLTKIKGTGFSRNKRDGDLKKTYGHSSVGALKPFKTISNPLG
jgi:hypothetical protein